MSSVAEKRFLKQALAAAQGDIASITPGFQIQAFHRGKLKLDLQVGRTWPYYDLASLTKILFTASVFMRWCGEGRLSLNQRVGEFWPGWTKRGPTLGELFSHHAGMPWWLPLHKKLRGPMDPEARWRQAEKYLLQIRARKADRALYSDIDLWLLGAVMVKERDRSLLEIWQELVAKWPTSSLHFNPRNRPKYKRQLYAPTEKCPWRKKTMQGEVHDENTWALAGVAPHAGLFGGIDDVSLWALELRRSFFGAEKSWLAESKIIRRFVRRQLPVKVGDWGFGFMKPSKKTASCGSHFSPASFGHTGFTGTSIWIDPKADLTVVILSNRVHPTRENARFVKYRPMLHDLVYQELIS